MTSPTSDGPPRPLLIAALVVALSYMLSSPSAAAVAESGVGSIIALIGTLIMAVGSVMWVLGAKHEPVRPLPKAGILAPVVTAFIAVLILFGSGFANYTSDERAEAVVTPELQAELDELEAEARDPETEQKRSLAIINQMAALRATAVNTGTITINGFTDDGSTMGRWLFVSGIFGMVAAVAASGFVFLNTRRQWIAGAVAMGFGAGIALTGVGWIGTLARATDQNVVSGVGIFLASLAGLTLANAGRLVINDFHRSRIYPEITDSMLSSVTGASGDGSAGSDDLEAVGAAN